MPDYVSILFIFSVPLALFLSTVALAVVEIWESLVPFYAGLIAVFVAFILTIAKVIEAARVPAPPPAKAAPLAPGGAPVGSSGASER